MSEAPENKSETPADEGSAPAEGAADTEKDNRYKPGQVKFGASYKGKRLQGPQRRPFRDHANLFIAATMLFLMFCIAFFLWNSYQTSRPRITRYIEPEKKMYPVAELVRANKVRDMDGDVCEITYDFDRLSKDAKARNLMLKDWKGGRNLNEDIKTQGEHQPILVDRTFGVPMAPLLSEVSFEHGLEMEVLLQPRQPSRLYLLFHYFYDHESTGTALVIAPDGQAQFIRFRGEMRFDEPRGTPGQLKVPLKEKSMIRIVVEEHPQGSGYRAKAYQGGQLITYGDFLPEWPKDRRYLRPDQNRFLVADNLMPPQSGFVAVASLPERSVLIHRFTVRGTVAKMWRVQRTEFLEAIGAPRSTEDKAQDETLPPASSPAVPKTQD